jgi:hypothetical protein
MMMMMIPKEAEAMKSSMIKGQGILYKWRNTYEILLRNLKESNYLRNQDIQNKFRGLSPQAKYTDRATASCRRS